jgi:two-component system OmpR family sensor kinase
LRETILALILPAIPLLLLCLAGIAWFTTTRLRPVARLAEEVTLRDANDLRSLSTPGLQAELTPIRDAVDRLMARLADALDAERAFSANAAHELRTPIAATLAQTQRLIAEAPDGPLRARARAIEAELKRIARLAEKLLDLARAEAASALDGSTGDLRPTLALVAGDFDLARSLTMPATPVAAGLDGDTFGILARNLIENAVRHGAPPIEIVLESDATLRVVNAGPALTPEDLARLTRRFERLGGSGEGSGLGLAIVEALVRNIGARMTLLSPTPGRADGLAAVIGLPPLTGTARAKPQPSNRQDRRDDA